MEGPDSNGCFPFHTTGHRPAPFLLAAVEEGVRGSQNRDNKNTSFLRGRKRKQKGGMIIIKGRQMGVLTFFHIKRSNDADDGFTA